MTIKPIREWKVQCPYCDHLLIYPEFKGGEKCITHKCFICNTKFICPSYKHTCESCKKQDRCMEYPSINPLIHRSTWRGCFDAWCSGFRALAIRDLECVFYLRGEPQSKVEPSEVKHLQIALYDKSITSLKIGKNTYTFHKPVPKPEFKPLQIHVGFFGRD